MLLQVRRASVRFSTHRAGEGATTVVQPLMPGANRRIAELAAAVSALVRLLSRVRSHVSLQPAIVLETLAADRAYRSRLLDG